MSTPQRAGKLYLVFRSIAVILSNVSWGSSKSEKMIKINSIIGPFEAITLKILFDSRLSNTLREDNGISLNSPVDQKLSRLLVEILGERNNIRIIHSPLEIVYIISKWAVSFHKDILSSVSIISSYTKPT